MKPAFYILPLLIPLFGCHVTRPPIDEDGIDSGAVERSNWRPSGPPAQPVYWEDSIDQPPTYVRVWRPDLGSGVPPPWEDWNSVESVRREHAARMHAVVYERYDPYAPYAPYQEYVIVK